MTVRDAFALWVSTSALLIFPYDISAQSRVDRALSLRAPPDQTASQPSAAVAVPAAPDGQAMAPTRRGSGGAYTSDAMGPSIVAKNADYETVFRITAVVPQRAVISKVSWRYGLSAKPAGFDAMLCLPRRIRCWNVSDSAIGSTSAFNGQDATQAFTLHYRVKGQGPLGPPARGEMNQLIVTYDLLH